MSKSSLEIVSHYPVDEVVKNSHAMPNVADLPERAAANAPSVPHNAIVDAIM